MIEVFDFEQNTPEWMQCRSGIPTCSAFKAILAKGEGKTRATYMRGLVGQRISGVIEEGFSNAHTERGHAVEPEAKDAYSLITDNEVERVGFLRNTGLLSVGPIGYSPDGLIDSNGALEIKSKKQELQVELLIADKFPPEHVPQCQGGLWVSEREWIDLVTYCRGLPVLIKRAYRDEPYIKKLNDEVAQFYEEMLEMEHKIRSKFNLRKVA